MVKMNGCAAIDSARPFRFLADKAAVAAYFHLENGACYHGKRRIASKSGEYPHRSLPFWQAMHGGTHFSLPANCETHLASNARVYTPVQSCWGNTPKPLNDSREIGYAPLVLILIALGFISVFQCSFNHSKVFDTKLFFCHLNRG